MNVGKLLQQMRDYFGVPVSKLNSMGFGRKINPVYLVNFPVIQEEGRVSQTLTQNVWYPVVDESGYCVVQAVNFSQAVANEDLEIRITTDDFTETVSYTAVAGTNYQLDIDTTTSAIVFKVASATSGLRSWLFAGRGVKVEVRKTTAAGANATACKVVYSK